jgi:CubicO group peptidase (beta-lactamase class C family)
VRNPIAFTEALAPTYTDGIIVLRRGKIVLERYFAEGAAQRPHVAFSVTKSFVGTLAAMLAAEGKLDPEAAVTKYVPELKDSAYGDATVRQVMDMTIGVKFRKTTQTRRLWCSTTRARAV